MPAIPTYSFLFPAPTQDSMTHESETICLLPMSVLSAFRCPELPDSGYPKKKSECKCKCSQKPNDRFPAEKMNPAQICRLQLLVCFRDAEK